MSERWIRTPNSPGGDAARLLLAAARERFSVAATDLLLPDTARLSEWQRLTANQLLARLIRTVEDMLRADLAHHLVAHDALHASLASTNVAIAQPMLDRAGVLRDADLITVLVRRVEEHRFWKARRGDDATADALLRDCIADEDADLSSEAMAVLTARSRRFDRFGEPVLARTELAADQQHKLVWTVAAALRQYMVQHHGIIAREADGMIAAAAARALARYDEGASLEARCLGLAARMDALGRLTDHNLTRALDEGLLPLFIAGIGQRVGLGYDPVWEILSDPRGLGPAILLRAADVERSHAATLLLALGSGVSAGRDGDMVEDQLDIFDGTDEPVARDVLRLWQVDPGYRAAVARLSTRARSIGEAA